MKFYQRAVSIVASSVMTLSLLTPSVAMATNGQPIEQQVQAVTLTQQLERITQNTWNHGKKSQKISTEKLLSLKGLVPLIDLQSKVNGSLSGETVSNYANLVTALIATESNPFMFNGKNYAEKLANAQTGEGYFSFGNNTDKKVDVFLKALLAVELLGADYNRESALSYLQNNEKDIFTLNGINLGLAVFVLSQYDSPQAQEYAQTLMQKYKTSKDYFASGVGLYINNLYALGLNPEDEQWHLQLTDDTSISARQAMKNLIHTDDTKTFYNRLQVGTDVGQSTEEIANTHWSLLGLQSLVEEKSMLQQVKTDFAHLTFDLSPKSILVTSNTENYVLPNTKIVPTFVVKDQYGTPRQGDITLTSSNTDVATINERNEIVAQTAGTAMITATVANTSAKALIQVNVTTDEALVALMPKIHKAKNNLLQEKFSTYEEAIALRKLGVKPTQILPLINVYGSNASAYNAARNILSVKAAGQDPSTYNNRDHVADLRELLLTDQKISAEEAAVIAFASDAMDLPVTEDIQQILVNSLTQMDNMQYVVTNDKPDVMRTSKVWQAITLIHQSGKAIQQETFAQAEQEIANYMAQQVNVHEKGNHANIAALQYMALTNTTTFGGLTKQALAESIVQSQYDNNYVTNGAIAGFAGTLSESTGIALNALQTLVTDDFSYHNLQVSQQPTTIHMQLPHKVKKNEPLALQAQLLDQYGEYMDGDIKWKVNGEEVTAYTPTTVSQIVVEASAQGVTAKQTIEVIDYEKVHQVKIEPLLDAVTDQAIPLVATITDSEGKIVTDEAITWSIEGGKFALNGDVVRFNEVGNYLISAEVAGIKAKSRTVQVTLNETAIQTKVAQAVEKMQAYLENRKQYDYISALAYSNVTKDVKKSQAQMRTLGHLREYGNHDEKYALYYAKNILLAAAANEDPQTFTTYKGPQVDLVTPLVQAQDKDGHFTMFTNFDKSSVTTQAWSIIALDLIEANYNKEAAITDLIAGLNRPISEGSYQEQELRALALIALSKHRDITGVDEQITRILTYLRAQQNDDAGFNYNGYTNNPFAIGTVIQGLIAVGENPLASKWKKNGKTMVETLLKQQIANGGFKFGDEFEEKYAFDELKATEAAFGALADIHLKQSMFNEKVIITDELPTINPQVKPFIEVNHLEVADQQPLLTVAVNAYDNVDGELTPQVKVNNEAVYSTSNTFKAVMQKGYNKVEISTTNSAGLTTTETIPVQFAAEHTQKVPQVNVVVKGIKGKDLITKQAIIEDQDTAYSVLVKTMGKNKVASRPLKEGVYVMGIDGLTEFDHGEGSGWMYRVNGKFPPVFSGEIQIKDGDTLEWLYTTNLGEDIGFKVPSTGGGTTTPEPKPEPEEETKSFVIGEAGQANVTLQDLQAIKDKVAMIKGEHNIQATLPLASIQELGLQQAEKLHVAIAQQGTSIHVKMEKTAGDQTTAVHFAKDYMTVTLPIAQRKNQVVLRKDGDTLVAVPHTIKDGVVTILTKGSGEFVIVEKFTTFSDLAKLAGREHVEFLASRNVINGVGGKTYEPHQPITRAHLAVMISRALGLQATKPIAFTDVKGKWYEQEVQALYEAGITTGKTATTFAPSATVTREQAAAIMARVLKYRDVKHQQNDKSYVDQNTIQAQFAQEVAWLTSLNIMGGKLDGRFDPKGQLTRMQLAKILHLTMDESKLMQ